VTRRAGLFLAALGALSLLHGQTNKAPSQLLNEVGFEPALGTAIPLNVELTDDQGRQIQMADLFQNKPLILALVYYQCPMLCNQVLNGLLASLKPLRLDAGTDFQVAAVSFHPKETWQTARSKKIRYVQSYGRPKSEAGWRFLTGQPHQVKRLTDAVNFRYAAMSSGDYAHASGVLVLTPDGRLSRYFPGVNYEPRDLRLGIVEASQGRIGSVVDRFLLLCYEYDPATGTYGLLIHRTLQLAGAATVAALGGFIFVMLRRERREKRLPAQGG
jgi:protein SCO1